jgi:hypothetical protein
MDYRDSELDDELRRLPAPRAPRTLLPRVMAAVELAAEQQEAAPWYSRAWVTWPRGLQVASATAVLLVAAAVIWGIPAASLASTTQNSTVGRALAPVRTVLLTAGEVSTLARVFWHTWLQPIASYFAAALILLSLVCFAAYSVVSRMTLETSPQ